MSFDNLGLKAELLSTVAELGYKEATPIQVKAIPAIIAKRDILAGAQTGTGKTAAFVLPILQLLDLTRIKRTFPRALVITPTRELAAQVGQSVCKYGKKMPFKSIEIFGGVSINPQIEKLRRGVDIVVATPGRLLDHARAKTIDLSRVEILVLDEADRMLDMGFIHDIKHIINLLPQKRQNLLFSATYSDDIRALATSLLDDPEMIEVARRNTAAEKVEQIMYPTQHRRKRELLSKLIHDGNWDRVLVFTRTKHGADRLARQLKKDDINAVSIHGDKSQSARTRSLADFKSSKARVLVATDIAARGLDIDRLPYVVNYDLPAVAEDYVHRIGRTGRAGLDGIAISLVSFDQIKLLNAIERLLDKKIIENTVDGFEYDKTDKPPVKQPRPQKSPRGKRDAQTKPHSFASKQGKKSKSTKGDAKQKRSGRPWSSKKTQSTKKKRSSRRF